MSDALTQNEIDELIAKATGSADLDFAVRLTPDETDTLGEIGNISMGAAATALYAILGRPVMITTPAVTVTTLEKLAGEHMLPFVVVDVHYTEGFAGNSLFILQLDDVRVITDIMMGGNGKPDDTELSELHISAISEAMNQMMGGMATSMAEMFNRIVNISPPSSQIVLLSNQDIRELVSKENTELIKICFKMEIEGLIDSNIMQLMPLAFGRQLVKYLLESTSGQQDNITIKKQPEISFDRTPDKEPGQTIPPSRPDKSMQTSIDVRPIQLTSFDGPAIQQDGQQNDSGIGLILDVPLQITVELGQCRKTIKEILDLNIGSIVTLDKLAGEPVDVVVNGKAVAKGEVIVIDDSYGIRITEVLSAGNRVKSAQVSGSIH